MYKKHIFIVTLSLAVFSIAFAQKTKLVSGDLSALKGTEYISIEYDYSDMKVGKMTETAYLEKKSSDYDKKEPGRGDKFKAAWENDRSARFEPKFEELFNKGLSKYDMSIQHDKDSDVTLKLHTTFTEPGFNIGIMRKFAEINVIATFMKDGNEIAKVTIDRSPGRTYGGYDFDTGTRVQESYAKAGKELAAFIAKKGLK